MGIVAGAELLIGAAAGWIQYVRGSSLRLGAGYPDFLLFYSVARLEAEGGFQHLYDSSAVLAMERAVTGAGLARPLPLTSPPYLAVLFRPFALTDFRTAYIVWALVTAALLAASVVLICRGARLRGRVAWAVGLLAAAWVPCLVAVLHAQLAGLVLFGAALAFLAWVRARQSEAGAGSVLTLARPHLVLLLPVLFLLRRRWIALAVCAGGALLLTAATLPATGAHAWADYLNVLLPGVLHGNQGFANAQQAPDVLRGLVEAVAGASLADLLLPMALLIAAIVLVSRTEPAPLLDFAVVTAAGLDAGLHQNLHDLTLLLVPLIALCGLLKTGAARFPVAGWAAVAATYLTVDAALFNQTITAAAVQLLVLYLFVERLAARREEQVAGGEQQ
jgi:hypothetical protein